MNGKCNTLSFLLANALIVSTAIAQQALPVEQPTQAVIEDVTSMDYTTAVKLIATATKSGDNAILIRFLKHRTAGVRLAAAVSLQGKPDPQIVKAVLDAYETNSSFVSGGTEIRIAQSKFIKQLLLDMATVIGMKEAAAPSPDWEATVVMKTKEWLQSFKK